MSDKNSEITPKVFISYSWSSSTHCDLIRGYADRLINDGVDVVIDQYDLQEGQDKYHFMEKMVRDPSITHVLAFSDKVYSEKANARKAGVGTESQIMSKEIYEKVDQTKFIPIFCELNEEGIPWLPYFFENRIGIDFSSLERTNQNWESLIRRLYGKPMHNKPALGARPKYLDLFVPFYGSNGKFQSLKNAVTSGRSATLYRRDFLDSIFQEIDETRTKERLTDIEEILSRLKLLLPLRDQLVDWALLEIRIEENDEKLRERFHEFLEETLQFRYHPPELTSYQSWWFDSQLIFIYEIWLYLVAMLLKERRDACLRELFAGKYFFPEVANKNQPFGSYHIFYGYSRALEERNSHLQLKCSSPVADIIKDRATRRDISFNQIIEAEAIVYADSLVNNKRWFPQTLVYTPYSYRLPFFVRAADERGLNRLLTVFGFSEGKILNKALRERLGEDRASRTQTLHGVEFGELYCWNLWNE